MPTDVSDEALRKMARKAIAEHNMIVAPWQLEWLLFRLRDLTAARCVEACEERARTRGVDPEARVLVATASPGEGHVHAMGVESVACAATILALFPGAKP